MTTTPPDLREASPALAQTVHGRPPVYLDSAATALQPLAMIDAIIEVYVAAASRLSPGLYTTRNDIASLSPPGRRARVFSERP